MLYFTTLVYNPIEIDEHGCFYKYFALNCVSNFHICWLFSDESGWGVQLDLFPGNVPSDVPLYSAACASEDGCLGQGNCEADFYRRVLNL